MLVNDGNRDAILRMGEKLAGLELYTHAMPVNTASECIVSLRELWDFGVIECVRIGKT